MPLAYVDGCNSQSARPFTTIPRTGVSLRCGRSFGTQEGGGDEVKDVQELPKEDLDFVCKAGWTNVAGSRTCLTN